jgi:hypothetical protein
MGDLAAPTDCSGWVADDFAVDYEGSLGGESHDC